MATGRRFSATLIGALDAAKIIGVRAGTSHKHTGVWVVVVEGRVFARSWSDQPAGWYRAFLAEPNGSLTVGDVERRVRAVPTRSQRLRDLVSKAFGAKYTTKASQKWVEGFAEAERAAHTMEFVPR